MKRFCLLAAPALVAILGCTPSPKGPGVNLGAPEIAWSAKNHEQQYGHMAAQVQPQMKALFVKYSSAYKDFNCQTCHGKNAELVDWKMPNPDIYPLPKENTLQESLDYDSDATNFMMADVTPALKTLLNTGAGAPTTVNCFSCHPAE